MITSQPIEIKSLFTFHSDYMELGTMSCSQVGVSLRDKGGRRSGITRRIYSYTDHIPERRGDLERRCGIDRRGGRERRSDMERRMNFESQSPENNHNLEPH